MHAVRYEIRDYKGSYNRRQKQYITNSFKAEKELVSAYALFYNHLRKP